MSFFFEKFTNQLSNEVGILYTVVSNYFFVHRGVTGSIQWLWQHHQPNSFSGVALISETYVCVAHTQVYFFL